MRIVGLATLRKPDFTVYFVDFIATDDGYYIDVHQYSEVPLPFARTGTCTVA